MGKRTINTDNTNFSNDSVVLGNDIEKSQKTEKIKDSFKIDLYFISIAIKTRNILFFMNVYHNKFSLLLINGPSRIILCPIKFGNGTLKS